MMANENKWEYDYSNIYHKPTAQSGYANVGSSGTNTANQAEATPYYTRPVQPNTAAQQTTAQGMPAQPNNATQQAQPTGAVTGMPPPPPYQNASYATAPQASQKKAAPKRVFSRMGFYALVALVGFVGGYAGNLYASSVHGAPSTVVVQQVERDASEDTEALSTSTAGADLSFVKAAAIANPSVVVITTEQMVATSGWYGTEAVQSGAGSGVIISEDGYILTCAHVVTGASNIIVTIGETDYTAAIIGSDEETDIAVIKINASGLTAAVLGDSDSLAVGETVLAVGNPLGELGGSVTQGIVSALNRVVVVENYEMTLIQMDASVSPGNSGGGLFNMAGELVGIVNAKSKDSDSEGIGFSIPINTAMSLASSLIENGYITGRPELGIVAVSITDAETAAAYGVNALGIYVYSINDGSAAAIAGLQVGDRLISIDDTEISVLSDLTDVIDTKDVGATVNLLIARDGQMLTVAVTLGEKGAPGAAAPSVSDSLLPDATSPEGETAPEDGGVAPEDGVLPGNGNAPFFPFG